MIVAMRVREEGEKNVSGRDIGPTMMPFLCYDATSTSSEFFDSS